MKRHWREAQTTLNSLFEIERTILIHKRNLQKLEANLLTSLTKKLKINLSNAAFQLNKGLIIKEQTADQNLPLPLFSSEKPDKLKDQVKYTLDNLRQGQSELEEARNAFKDLQRQYEHSYNQDLSRLTQTIAVSQRKRTTPNINLETVESSKTKALRELVKESLKKCQELSTLTDSDTLDDRHDIITVAQNFNQAVDTYRFLLSKHPNCCQDEDTKKLAERLERFKEQIKNIALQKGVAITLHSSLSDHQFIEKLDVRHPRNDAEESAALDPHSYPVGSAKSVNKIDEKITMAQYYIDNPSRICNEWQKTQNLLNELLYLIRTTQEWNTPATDPEQRKLLKRQHKQLIATIQKFQDLLITQSRQHKKPLIILGQTNDEFIEDFSAKPGENTPAQRLMTLRESIYENLVELREKHPFSSLYSRSDAVDVLKQEKNRRTHKINPSTRLSRELEKKLHELDDRSLDRLINIFVFFKEKDLRPEHFLLGSKKTNYSNIFEKELKNFDFEIKDKTKLLKENPEDDDLMRNILRTKGEKKIFEDCVELLKKEEKNHRETLSEGTLGEGTLAECAEKFNEAVTLYRQMLKEAEYIQAPEDQSILEALEHFQKIIADRAIKEKEWIALFSFLSDAEAKKKAPSPINNGGESWGASAGSIWNAGRDVWDLGWEYSRYIGKHIKEVVKIGVGTTVLVHSVGWVARRLADGTSSPREYFEYGTNSEAKQELPTLGITDDATAHDLVVITAAATLATFLTLIRHSNIKAPSARNVKHTLPTAIKLVGKASAALAGLGATATGALYAVGAEAVVSPILTAAYESASAHPVVTGIAAKAMVIIGGLEATGKLGLREKATEGATFLKTEGVTGTVRATAGLFKKAFTWTAGKLWSRSSEDVSDSQVNGDGVNPSKKEKEEVNGVPAAEPVSQVNIGAVNSSEGEKKEPSKTQKGSSYLRILPTTNRKLNEEVKGVLEAAPVSQVNIGAVNSSEGEKNEQPGLKYQSIRDLKSTPSANRQRKKDKEKISPHNDLKETETKPTQPPKSDDSEWKTQSKRKKRNKDEITAP